MPRTLVLILTSLVLASCGGSGSGSGTTPPPPVTNSPPAVSTTSFNVNQDTDLVATVQATDADNDAVTFTKTGNPAHGQITAFATTGAFTYRPTASFSGTDSFTIQAADPTHQVAATITITVTAMNGAPTVRDDIATVAASNAVVDVLANDVDPDGDPLTITIESGPTYGTASVVNGKVQLSLPAGFKGFNRFTYRATDSRGAGGTATAAVFVDTTPVRLVYVSNEGNGLNNLYVNDLLRERPVSNITSTSSTFLGHNNVSTNGQTIVFEEATGDVGNNYRAQSIWTAPTDGSSAARQISAALQTGEQLSVRSSISPDGKWVVYGVLSSGGAEQLYLADLGPTGTATPIPVPTGALRIESSTQQGIQFGPTSQYVYFTATFAFGGASIGQATYRIPVSNPSAAVLLSTAAVINKQAAVAFVSTDETRAVEVVSDGSTLGLERVDLASPGAPVTLSHTLIAGQTFSGLAADPALTHVAYVVFSPNPANTFDLYSADTAVATSGTFVRQLPGPQSLVMAPTADATLYTTLQVVSGNTVQELSEIGLTPGATPVTILSGPQNSRSKYSYVDGGQSVAFMANPGVAIAPRTNLAAPQTLFAKDTALYEFSADSQLLAAVTDTTETTDPLHLYLVSRGTSTPLQITGLTTPSSQTLSIRVVPSN